MKKKMKCTLIEFSRDRKIKEAETRPKPSAVTP